MSKFAVVEFTKDNTVDIVPVSWLLVEEDQCHWPSLRSDKVAQLVKEQQKVDKRWPLFAVVVLGKASKLL